MKNSKKEYADIQNQNEVLASTRAAIDAEIQQTQNKASSYSRLAQIIQSDGTSFDTDDELYAVFDSYQLQIESAEEKERIKTQILAEIQTTIDQLTSAILSYQTQSASAGAYVQHSSTLDEQLAALKSQQLLSVDKELLTINMKIDELSSQTVDKLLRWGCCLQFFAL